jgi:hypothetical protein
MRAVFTFRSDGAERLPSSEHMGVCALEYLKDTSCVLQKCHINVPKNFWNFEFIRNAAMGTVFLNVWVPPQNPELASVYSAGVRATHSIVHPLTSFWHLGVFRFVLFTPKRCTGNKTWRQGVGCYFPRIAMVPNWFVTLDFYITACPLHKGTKGK